jgi:hypothetical protein
MAIEKKGMSPYEAERERTVQENKRKMEALNLRHLSAAVASAAYAPKTPSPMVTHPSSSLPRSVSSARRIGRCLLLTLLSIL